ncbi:tetratricopeptide repeat protein [Amycolatopsis sp. NPDC054798]
MAGTRRPARRRTTLSDLGGACPELGRFHDAVDYLGQVLEANRAAGNRWGEAWTLTSLVNTLRDRGRLAEEIRSYLYQTALTTVPVPPTPQHTAREEIDPFRIASVRYSSPTLIARHRVRNARFSPFPRRD